MSARTEAWRQVRWALAVLLASHSLGCDSPGTQPILGDLECAAAPPSYGKDVTIPLGETLAGDVAEGSLWLRNAGLAPITLTGLSEESGEPVRVGSAPDPEHPFAVDLPIGRSIAPGDELRLAIRLRSDEARPSLSATLRITASGTRPAEGVVRVALQGAVLPSPCAMPEELDFGTVLVGQKASRALALKNPLSSEAEAHVSVPASDMPGTSGYFFYEGGGPGTLSVPAAGAREVVVGFQPAQAKRYEASIEVSAAPTCAPVRVRLVGEAVARFLDWEPAKIDCGLVLPGDEVQRTVRLTNRAPEAIAVVGAAVGLEGTSLSGEFELPADSWGPGGAFSLAAGESTERVVTCAPSTLGKRAGTLELTTDIPGQETVRIPLEAKGGGPRIAVEPGRVDLGSVFAYVAGATVPEQATLTILNEGEALPEDATRAALKLGTRQPDGSMGPPYFRVEPLNAETLADEVSLELDVSVAILPRPWINRVTVPVRLSPRTSGHKRARVWVLSNDKERPEGSFEVTAQVRFVAACEYQVTPNPLDFGVVHFSMPKTLGATIENTGTETCHVQVLGLSEGSEDYSVESLPQEIDLEPGRTFPIRVKLAPRTRGGQSYGRLPGRLRLRVSSPTRPEAEVLLEGGTGLACLALEPGELDFGAVKPGERSEERLPKVAHLCAGLPGTLFGDSLRLRNVTLAGGAPDFQMRVIEAIPAAGHELWRDVGYLYGNLEGRPNSRVVAVRYSPRSEGMHEGSIVFEVEHREGVMKHVLPLRGRGNADRWAEVAYRQTGGDLVDVLFHYSSDPSLGWSRDRIADQMPAFLEHLAMSGNDYQIGIHWQCDKAPGCGSPIDRLGDFPSGPDHPDRVLTSSTPALLEQMQRKLRLPVEEHDMTTLDIYRAWRALVPPSSLGANAGFLRPSARLAFLYINNKNDADATTPPIESADFVAYGSPFPVVDIGDYSKLLASLKGAMGGSKFSFASLSFIRSMFQGYPLQYDANCCSPGSAYLCEPAWQEYARWPAQIIASTAGGEVAELCPQEESEWPHLVEILAEAASGLRTHFKLPPIVTPDPSPGSIEVSVDGVPVPSTDASGALVWEYEAAYNAVHFPVAKTPRPGQHVRVRYRTKAPMGE